MKHSQTNKYANKDQIKILFMGTPEMAAMVLSSLIKDGYSVVGVVCQEDKITGRKRELTPPPTKKVALANGIHVFQPHKIRSDYSFAENLDFDVIVTMAYGQIIPTGLLSLSKVGNVNLHGSLLPKYRGAAPIQRAIIEGEKTTGVTLMEMVEAMDAGDMYDKRKIIIEENDNYSSLCIKMADAASSLICEDLIKYCNNELKPIKQNEDQVTFAYKIKPIDEKLDLTLGCFDFINYVRGLSDVPGGYLLLRGKKIKIYECAKESDDKNHKMGQLIKNKKRLLLQLSDGVVRLKKIQLEGKKIMEDTSFLQGFSIEEGEYFS